MGHTEQCLLLSNSTSHAVCLVSFLINATQNTNSIEKLSDLRLPVPNEIGFPFSKYSSAFTHEEISTGNVKMTIGEFVTHEIQEKVENSGVYSKNARSQYGIADWNQKNVVIYNETRGSDWINSSYLAKGSIKNEIFARIMQELDFQDSFSVEEKTELFLGEGGIQNFSSLKQLLKNFDGFMKYYNCWNHLS